VSIRLRIEEGIAVGEDLGRRFDAAQLEYGLTGSAELVTVMDGLLDAMRENSRRLRELVEGGDSPS
jgi:hypothetical protein